MKTCWYLLINSFQHQEESAKLGKNASTCIIIIIIIDHMGS